MTTTYQAIGKGTWLDLRSKDRYRRAVFRTSERIANHDTQNILIEGRDTINNVLSLLAELGLQGVKEEDLPKLLGPDKFEEELIVMAEVSAYFRVAYKVSDQD